MENEHQEQDSSQDQFMEETGQMKQWLQDNLRIIVSIVIVVAIAAGIYSYSNRSPLSTQELTEEKISQEKAAPQEGIKEEPISPWLEEKKTATPVPSSQETETSFVETAGAGNGTTHLARRAAANYLEKNPDTSLTPEHKIYIEDFLRKNVSRNKLFLGDSVEFSKDLIQQAIAKSKTLNERQLKNLSKYAARVPSLS